MSTPLSLKFAFLTFCLIKNKDSMNIYWSSFYSVNQISMDISHFIKDYFNINKVKGMSMVSNWNISLKPIKSISFDFSWNSNHSYYNYGESGKEKATHCFYELKWKEIKSWYE